MCTAAGALLSAIVVMLMTPLRSTREWAMEFISTVVIGIGGVAIAVQYFRLQEWVDSVTGLVALGGLIFGCGLPGWAIVHWVFNFIERNQVRTTSVTNYICGRQSLTYPKDWGMVA